jgi:hypothetical protein
MLERVDLFELIEMVDRPEVRDIMPGLGRDERLRRLAGCIWLRDGASVAVIQQKWLGQYAAIIFDVDNDPDFAWAVMNLVFNTMEGNATSFRFPSRHHDLAISIGRRISAKARRILVGFIIGSCPAWSG